MHGLSFPWYPFWSTVFFSPSCTVLSALSGKVSTRKLYTFTSPVPLATRSTDTRLVSCVFLMYCDHSSLVIHSSVVGFHCRKAREELYPYLKERDRALGTRDDGGGNNIPHSKHCRMLFHVHCQLFFLDSYTHEFSFFRNKICIFNVANIWRDTMSPVVVITTTALVYPSNASMQAPKTCRHNTFGLLSLQLFFILLQIHVMGARQKKRCCCNTPAVSVSD